MTRYSSAGRWTIFIVRRLAGSALAMFGVVVLVFSVSHVLGDPAEIILGPRASAQQLAQLRHQLGYDQPLLRQFWSYLGDLVHGDLGISQYTRRPVTDELRQRFPATIELAVAGLLLGLLWTIPLGVIAALRPRGIVDRIGQALVEFGVAIPSFLLGVLLILFLYAGLGIAPSPVGELDISAVAPPRVTGLTLVDSLLAGQWSTFSSALEHLALPALTLAITACPPLLQLTRNSMIEVLRGDYIRSARSLGLPQSTIRWYAFKNAMLPVSTMTAMTFGYLLGGTVLVEQVFSWPGIGLYAVQSLQQLDYAPVLGVVLLASAVYVLVYLLADLLAVVIDPRLREGD